MDFKHFFKESTEMFYFFIFHQGIGKKDRTLQNLPTADISMYVFS